MEKTIAEVIQEEGIAEGIERGELKGKREAILRQLQVKFKHVPAEINATPNTNQLND